MIAKRVLKNSTFLSKHLVIGILTVRIGGFGKINFLILVPGVVCGLSLLLVLVPAPRVFLRVSGLPLC